jgi:ferric-dicitrate binding protein FerR (iron transport regulator)
MNSNGHIDILLAKVVSGNATDAEKRQLDDLLARENNQTAIQKAKTAWDNSNHFFTIEEIGKDGEKLKDRLIAQLSAKKTKLSARQRFYWAAAVLLLPLMLGIGWYLGSGKSTSAASQWCEVITPKGQLSECVLADGTRVWLNAGTTLKYKAGFDGSTRQVELKGEAYFKVAPDPNKPFIVTANHVQVKVLGTSFNLKAYENDKLIETSLEEGKIELSIMEQDDQPLVMVAGQQVIYNIEDKTLNKGQVDLDMISSWRNGKYIFRDADMTTIVRELERLYDVKVHMGNGKFSEHRFRGVFSYDDNILDAMETLGRTIDFTYTIKGREIWLE